MRKLFVFFGIVLATASVIADEAILFSSTTNAELDGFSYAENFEIVSDSGRFSKDDLITLRANEDGIRFAAVNPPEDISCSYMIVPAYPSFLNGVDGAGSISNAGDIKSVKIVCSLNRPYDDVFLLYSTSPLGKVISVKIPHDPTLVKSMESTEFVFENPLYQSDPKKRDIKSEPIVGGKKTGIYLRGFKVQTNAPTGTSTYSPYSIFCLKEVSVIYDRLRTEEQIEVAKRISDEFGFSSGDIEIAEKAKRRISEREAARKRTAELMDKSAIQTSNPTDNK